MQSAGQAASSTTAERVAQERAAPVKIGSGEACPSLASQGNGTCAPSLREIRLRSHMPCTKRRQEHSVRATEGPDSRARAHASVLSLGASICGCASAPCPSAQTQSRQRAPARWNTACGPHTRSTRAPDATAGELVSAGYGEDARAHHAGARWARAGQLSLFFPASAPLALESIIYRSTSVPQEKRKRRSPHRTLPAPLGYRPPSIPGSG